MFIAAISPMCNPRLTWYLSVGIKVKHLLRLISMFINFNIDGEK